jgi:branched-chain amino acid transport system permease protein
MALVAILGGVGTLVGPVVGAVVLTGIEEASRIAFGGTGRGTDLVIYGGLIVVIAVYQPAGIMGFVRQRWPAPEASPRIPPPEGEAEVEAR